MFKKGKYLILLFVIIFMIGAVSAQDLSESQIEPIADSTFDDAQMLIDFPGDTVFLMDSYYYADHEDYPITIDKNVTIMGLSEVTFDGKGISQIFSIGKNCKVTFMGINFINGKGTNGGAINIDTNSSVEFLNTNMINNTAVNGGVIFTGQYSNVSLLNANISNNSATNVGGAIFLDYKSDFYILNANVYNNSALENGGAIFANGKFTALTVSFKNNSAKYGGAIFCGNDSQVLPLDDNFTNNKAIDGGAIYVGKYSNAAVGMCNFTENIATNAGGALYATSNSNSTTIASDFKDNSAKYGGAIASQGTAAEFVALTCNFTNNIAIKGGALYANNGSLGAGKSNFINNKAELGESVLGENNARVYLKNNNYVIGQIYINSSSLDLFNNTFDGSVNPIVVVNTSVENKTYLTTENIKTAPYSIVNITIGLYDDNGNPIKVLGGINATVGDKIVNVLFNNKTNSYTFEFKTSGIGNYTISSNLPDFKSLDKNEGILEVYYNTILNVTANSGIFGENITINAKINAKGNLTFKINNKNYTVSIIDGQANLTLSNLSAGRYDVDVIFEGNENYSAASANCNFSVYNSINIFADNVVMYYGDGSKLNAQVVDYKGDPIAGEKIQIIANGEEYGRTTDDEGWISFDIKLNVGNYTFTLNYKDASVNVSVEIKSTIVSSNLVKMFHNQSHYYAKFLTENGTPLVDHKVTFNVNGIFYNRTTDWEGKAELKINLGPDKYVLTAINLNNGEMASYNITVLSLITADNIVKFYKNDTQYLIKTYDNQGNIAPWQTVKINIHGVFYWKTSDANGIAKLNINLYVGEYIATVEFMDCIISNNITVLSSIESKNLEMTNNNRVPFVVKVLDNQGRPSAGAKLEFNINGVLYPRTTSDNGTASLNINLMPGQYIITTMANDLFVSNIITITA